jgi:hypothetical protein
MKRSILKDAICKLKAAGWRIYLDGRSPDGVQWDFLPWDDDDLIPVSDAAERALLCALAGDPVPPRDGR